MVNESILYKPASFAEIAYAIEHPLEGYSPLHANDPVIDKIEPFRRDVAGETDFSRAVRAIQRAAETGKGILFTGTNGCGKTLLLRILYRFSRPYTRKWIDCNNHLHLEWLTDPIPECMYNYSLFVDDYGGEQLQYGDVDRVGAFLVNWYDMATRGLRLYLTTNFTGQDILEKRGGRLHDRLNAMCVICPLDGKSKRTPDIIW